MRRSMMAGTLAVTFLSFGVAMAADLDVLVANWKAMEVNGNAVDGLTLDYAADKVSGDAGCNRFFGPIAISDDDKVKIGPLAATRKMCEGKMEIERDYLAALEAVRSFALEEGTLVLKGEDGAVLVKLRK